MPVIIPFDSNNVSYTLQVQLEGSLYSFRTLYNERTDTWSFDMLDEDNVTLLSGRKIVADADVLVAFPTTIDRPMGFIQFYDTAGEGLIPGRLDLGDRVKAYYFSAAEVESL